MEAEDTVAEKHRLLDGVRITRYKMNLDPYFTSYIKEISHRIKT